MDFLYTLKNTPQGLDVLVKALSTQSTISKILEDRFFDIPPLIRDMPQQAREQLLMDEEDFAIRGILEFDQGYGDVIDQTICGASDPQQRIKLITAYGYHSGSIIKWLDQMSPEDRHQCLAHENVIMSLGDSFFYDSRKGVDVEHALDRWGAHHLRRVLHYAVGMLSEREIMFWACIAPVIYTDEEMGDFQAPPLPPETKTDSVKIRGMRVQTPSAEQSVQESPNGDWDIPF